MVLAVPLSCRSFTLLSLLFCFLCCWAILSSSQQQEDQSNNEDKSQKDQLCLRKRHSVLLFCYRVTQTDSLIAFNFVYVKDSLASARVLFYGRRGDPKYWLQILTNHIIESKCNALNMQDQRQRPHLLDYSTHDPTTPYAWLRIRIKINRMLSTFQLLTGRIALPTG